MSHYTCIKEVKDLLDNLVSITSDNEYNYAKALEFKFQILEKISLIEDEIEELEENNNNFCRYC